MYVPNQSSEELHILEANTVALCSNSTSSPQPEQYFTGVATRGGKEKLPLKATPGKKSTATEKDWQDRKIVSPKDTASGLLWDNRKCHRSRWHQKRTFIKELKKYSVNCTGLKKLSILAFKTSVGLVPMIITGHGGSNPKVLLSHLTIKKVSTSS